MANRLLRFAAGIVCSLLAGNSIAAAHYQAGNISNITSVTEGLLLKLDSGQPDNCVGTPYGWMLIPSQHTTMISTVLAIWIADRKTVTVYTSGRPNGQGYCLINQVDPLN